MYKTACSSFRNRWFARFDCLRVRCSSCKQSGADGGSPEEAFFSSFSDRKKSATKNKVTVIGVGQVGMACAVSCLYYGLTTHLCLYDMDKKKSEGEVKDLQHSSLFLKGARITAANEISQTADSKLVIVTAGARQKVGEKRPELMGRNVDIFKSFIPDIVKHSPNCSLLIVTNPCDAMTYVAWKLSGLPLSRVLGSGTNLDSSRFRFLIAEKLSVNVKNSHGFIIGEHGDTSVPVWSGVSVAGVALRSISPTIGLEGDPKGWGEIHKKTVGAAYEVIKLKGYTSWAVGFSVGQLSEALIKNTLSIHCVSTNLNGRYQFKEDVFASVPCILGDAGVLSIINLPLSDLEQQLLHKSAEAILELQRSSKL